MNREISLPLYSVLMSVYAGDDPSWFESALQSLEDQTFVPDEILLMQDGPVSEALKEVETRFCAKYPDQIRLIRLEKNVGLGEAMRIGLPECRNEWIARMDSDDISAPERCEAELRAALQNNADIVGCDCAEFQGTVKNIVAYRVFPEKNEDILIFSKRKNPFCHPAVMMKKEMVLASGNYRNAFLYEDYDLFVRMLRNGAVGYTVKDMLYYIRVSDDFYSRRGGKKYVKALLSYNLELLRSGWMSPSDFLVRSGGNILFGLAPVKLRTFLYRRVLRK